MNIQNHTRLIAGGLGAILILGSVLFMTPRIRGLGLKGFVLSKIHSATSMSKAVLNSSSVSGNDDMTNILFLHHSTGRNLIQQGDIRERFTNAGYKFWDHGYNAQGLTKPNGSSAGYSYSIPWDNTNPDGIAQIFAQKAYHLPLNAFSGLLQHDVIIFKSCFPVSRIASDEQLSDYKSYYLSIRDTVDQHPNKLFIVVTQPPSNPESTNAEEAARARKLANWLKSDEYLDGHPNLSTFDFYNYLAEDDPTSPDYNMLKKAYREGADSHPNKVANEIIGPHFVDFVIDAIRHYRAYTADDG